MIKGRLSGPFIFYFIFVLVNFNVFLVMTGIIEIEGMEFFAYHGCFEAEQVVGNKFIVYACLYYACDCPAESDNIGDALSYQTAYEIIAREMMVRSHLLEHVGLRMLNALYDSFPQLTYAKVKISKMNPPLGGQIKGTSVTMEK